MRKGVVFLGIVLSIALCFGYLHNRSLDQELSETTIHNETKKAVLYSIKLSRLGEKAEDKVILPRGTDHYSGDVVLELAFQRSEKKIVHNQY